MTTLKRYNPDSSQWETIAAGQRGYIIPTGGADKSFLSKNSSTDRDASWGDLNFAGHDSAALNTSGAYFDGAGLNFYGINGNYASTPDAAPIKITGDIDIQVKATLANWSPGIELALMAKWQSTTSRSYRLYVFPDGRLNFAISTTGQNILETFSTSSVGFSPNATKWVRATMDADNGSSARVIKFYTSDDGVSWSQLGNTVTPAAAVTVFDSTSVLEIGSQLLGTQIPLSGKILRVKILNGFDGAGSVVFDADFESVPANSLAFSESSANAATVSLTTTRYQYGTPGTHSGISSSLTLASNRDFFHFFYVHKRITVDMVQFNVITGPTSNSGLRCGVYAADGNFQPTGEPFVNSVTGVLASTAGVGPYYQSITPVILEPGAYCGVMCVGVQMAVRGVRAGMTFMGASTNNITYQASRDGRGYNAYTSSNIFWNGFAADGQGILQRFFLRWYEV